MRNHKYNIKNVCIRCGVEKGTKTIPKTGTMPRAMTTYQFKVNGEWTLVRPDCIKTPIALTAI